jgi:hypothetical protein
MSFLKEFGKLSEDDLPRTHGTIVNPNADQFPYKSAEQVKAEWPADRKLKDAIANMAGFVDGTRKLPIEQKIKILDYFRDWVLKLDLVDYLKTKNIEEK